MGQGVAELVHTVVEIFASLVTTAAVLVGGWWFFLRRAGVRKANVTHAVAFAAAGDQIYMNVRVVIKNSGNRQIVVDGDRLKKGIDWGNLVLVEEVAPFLESNEAEMRPSTAEFQLLPIDARAFPGKLVIEPNEEQAIVFDFMIPGSSAVVRVYSHIDNAYNEGSGWNTTTIHKVEVL